VKIVHPTIEDLGVEKLYPEPVDRSKELQKMARSLLLNFVELIGILGVNPGEVRHSSMPIYSVSFMRA
jgi:MED7 protein